MTSNLITINRVLVVSCVAALIMPVLVAVAGNNLSEELILFLWPGSILLLSLGAEHTSAAHVALVWSVSVLSNLVLYTMVGLILLGVARLTKR